VVLVDDDDGEVWVEAVWAKAAVANRPAMRVAMSLFMM
jgi:hypothetical protein